MPVFISIIYHPAAGQFDSQYFTNPRYWSSLGVRRNRAIKELLCVSS